MNNTTKDFKDLKKPQEILMLITNQSHFGNCY